MFIARSLWHFRFIARSRVAVDSYESYGSCNVFTYSARSFSIMWKVMRGLLSVLQLFSYSNHGNLDNVLRIGISFSVERVDVGCFFFFAVVITIAGAAREGDREQVPEKKIEIWNDWNTIFRHLSCIPPKIEGFKPPKCPSGVSTVEVPVSCCQKWFNTASNTSLPFLSNLSNLVLPEKLNPASRKTLWDPPIIF